MATMFFSIFLTSILPKLHAVCGPTLYDIGLPEADMHHERVEQIEDGRVR